MKQLFFIIIIALFCNGLSIAQPLDTSPFNAKDSSYIIGKINGFTPGQKDGFVSIQVYDILGKNKKRSFQINNDGSFRAVFYQQFPGDITFSYKGVFANLYAIPADTLKITIADNLINDDTGNKGAFAMSGKTAVINNLLYQFHQEFNLHQFKNTASMGDKAQSDSTYAVRRMIQLKEELAFLQAFISTNKIDNAVFIAWQKNDLVYSAGKDAALYPFLGKLNRTITATQLTDLVKNIPINNPGALQNSAYYDFLAMMNSGLQISVNLNPVYDDEKKKNGFNSLPIYLALIDAQAQGLPRQLMYYDVYRHYNKNNLQAIHNKFVQTITNPYLKDLCNTITLNTDEFKAYSIASRINTLKIDTALKAKMTALFDKYKGTNLFIDFWGDWCQPCMHELPGYPATIAQFKGKPLKFLFLSAFTTNTRMLDVKAMNGIDADFINLTNNEVAVLNDAFDFHSYPSHFIINTKGEVISNRARNAEQITEVLFPKAK